MGEQIIVLGGGVVGLSCAFECLRRGHKVVVLEKETCGGQASGAAAGMLAPYSENGDGPDDFFRLSLESLRIYPQWQEDVKKVSGMSFEYGNSGSLYAVFHEADLLALEERMHWQRQFGAEARILQGDELFREEANLSRKAVAALHIPQESHVYAPHYVQALEHACRLLGADIYEHVREIEIAAWKSGIELRAQAGAFSADRLVVCTGAWTRQWESVLGLTLPIYPIRGQICAYETPLPLVRHMVFSSQGYLVSKANGTLVCGASEDIAGFSTEVTEKGISRLRSWNKNVFPFLEERIPFHSWAGLRPATQDGFPLLGNLPLSDRVIMASGHYRNGILLSPVTGMIVADLIDGIPSKIPLGTFSPERFS